MSKFEVGKIYSSNNYGDYKVLEKIDRCHFVVQFLKTGYTRSYAYATMLEGAMRDPYFPLIYNVGYLGEINIKNHKKELNIWRFMLARCYDEKHGNYKTYGAKGVYVCDRWLCFKDFVDDIPKIN